MPHMQRFKITPEVILKSLNSFLIGAAVGFLAFRLVTKFSPNLVSAFTKTNNTNKETEEVEEKTTFPLDLEINEEKSNLYNNAESTNVVLKTVPNIVPPLDTDE